MAVSQAEVENPSGFNERLEYNQDFKLDWHDPDEATDGYQLKWVGKDYARLQAGTAPKTVIIPDNSHNKDNENSQNIFLTGDNLEVLKHLQNSYKKEIKMIYIDPPYNTGSDGFVYNDTFEFKDEQLKDMLGLTDDEVKRLHVINGRSSHSAWLTFMYPRLKIARNLLSDDGVIFISIDDNEQANLKLLCDEIFGEGNFVDVFYIQVRYANKSLNEKDDFQKLIEQVLVYAKSGRDFVPNKPFEEYDIEKFCNEIIEDEQGETITLGGKTVTVFKPGQFRIIQHPHGKIGLLKDTWASGSVLAGNTSGKFFDNYIGPRKDIDGLGCLYKVEGIGEDGLGYRYFTGPKKKNATKGQFYSGVPLNRVQELEDGGSKKYKPIVNFYDMSGDFGNIRHEGGVDFRAGKKPTKMIRFFLDIIGDTDCTVLDFFAGSATTAHAVMQLNKEDGGNRKWILCNLDEPTNENSDARRDGYNTIDEISRTRIKNASQKLEDTSGFKHYYVKEPGALTIDKITEFDPDSNKLIAQDMVSEFDNKKTGTKGEDVILTTWLIADGYKFTDKVKELDFKGFKAHYIDNSLLYIISNGWGKEQTEELLNLVGTRKMNLNRIIVYGYSFILESMKELEINVKQSLNNQVKVVKRY